MSIFTICTDFAPDGELDDVLAAGANAEKKFTREIGVLDRHYFQCTTNKQVLWAYTEWETLKHHNDAAEGILECRRDDRIASILFGPSPYFECFCREQKEFSIGDHSPNYQLVIVGDVLISEKNLSEFTGLRQRRWEQFDKSRIDWLRVFTNAYSENQFTFFMGFTSEERYKAAYDDDLALEEWLFTGLQDPMKLSAVAGYNQFRCVPLDITRYS